MSRPNALYALSRVGIKVAEYGCYVIILVCLYLAWVGTP